MISSLVVALVTPFNSRGVVDWGALGEYLEFLSERRVRDVLVGGTTGEFASLTLDERRHLLEFCRSRWSGALIAHVGSSCLTDAVALSDHAQDHADVIAAMPPYFFAHPPEAGVLEYFRALGHRSVRPLLLYNFPMHTQARISAEMVEVLARDLPNLLGVKDSDKDHALSKRYKSGNSALRVFLGDDSAAAMYAILGCDGVVTGAGGAVVEWPVAITEAVERGDAEEATRLQGEFDTWSALRRAAPVSSIAFTKATIASRLKGFPVSVRVPLVAADEGSLRIARRALSTLPRWSS